MEGPSFVLAVNDQFVVQGAREWGGDVAAALDVEAPEMLPAPELLTPDESLSSVDEVVAAINEGGFDCAQTEEPTAGMPSGTKRCAHTSRIRQTVWATSPWSASATTATTPARRWSR